jgi:hypothetical protein
MKLLPQRMAMARLLITVEVTVDFAAEGKIEKIWPLLAVC